MILFENCLISCIQGGKYKSCEEIFEEEYADEYSESENSIDGSNGAGNTDIIDIDEDVLNII